MRDGYKFTLHFSSHALVVIFCEKNIVALKTLRINKLHQNYFKLARRF